MPPHVTGLVLRFTPHAEWQPVHLHLVRELRDGMAPTLRAPTLRDCAVAGLWPMQVQMHTNSLEIHCQHGAAILFVDVPGIASLAQVVSPTTCPSLASSVLRSLHHRK